MTKRVARHGGSPAPYTKQHKAPYRYDHTPLHRPAEGIPVTRKNLVAFYTRLGNRVALAKLENDHD